MIEPLSTDENARAILGIFQDKGVQAGEALTAALLYEAFVEDHGAENYAAALRRASEKGWLLDEGDVVRLTASGSKEL